MRRIDNDGGFDARITHWRGGRNFVIFELLAGAESRAFAIRQSLATLWVAADDNKARIAAH